MIALAIVGFAHAADLSPVDAFNAAAYVASRSVGKASFAADLEAATWRCTSTVPGCAEQLEELQAADAKARAPKPAPAAVAPVAAPAPAAVADAFFYDPTPTFDGDPSHRYDYTATLGRPAGPAQRGFRVSTNDSLISWVDQVCVWKDGAPLPIGQDEWFTMGNSGERFLCAGIRPHETINVPDNAQIYLAQFNGSVYVVKEIRSCGTNTSTERLRDKEVTGCSRRVIRN